MTKRNSDSVRSALPEHFNPQCLEERHVAFEPERSVGNIVREPTSVVQEPLPFDWKLFSSFQPVGGHTKRLLDLSIAFVAIALIFPLMLVIALACGMSGPPIYSHRRVGFRGREFKCHKFRTMVLDSDAVLDKLLEGDEELARLWATHRKLPNDPRVTPIGRFLRKSSLDELPQLFNILKGEMSLVGPRPVTAEEVSYYGASAYKYLAARPGLTGLWQVSGRNLTTFAERVQLDVSYVDHWSLRSDVGIIARTPAALMRFRMTS